MQIEKSRARAALLNEINDGSITYAHLMTQAGVEILQRRPRDFASVNPGIFEYYLVPVNGPDDAKFRFVDHITKSGLTAIVLASGRIGETAVQAERLNAICFRLSHEPEDVMAVANWIKRNQATAR